MSVAMPPSMASGVPMRLLNVHTLQFTTFLDPIPPYVIASHRWADSEVTFQQVRDKQQTQSAGYIKVKKFVEFMRREMPTLNWLWIDTCCIDKSSSQELTEAITSMYKWYEKSKVCVAFLNDVQDQHSERDMRTSAWFTRGWTLQELLAPLLVLFVSREWNVIGHKAQDGYKYNGELANRGQNLNTLVANITRIPEKVITHSDVLESLSVNEKLEWIADRKTTRPEDLSYSLIGILGLFMPLQYGEGQDSARHRLLEAAQPAEVRNKMTERSHKLPFNLSHIPEIQKYFVQCPENFLQLDRLFADVSRRRYPKRETFVVHGLGGAGKTQLCAHFIHARHHDFSSVLWLDGSSLDALKRSLTAVAARLPRDAGDARASDSSQADVDVVLRWLSHPENQDWLLVFDGIDRDWQAEPKDPQAFDYKDFLPNNDHGTVLLTTRLYRLHRSGISVALDAIDPKIGRQILEATANGPLGADADLLVEKLARLPLALAQAGIHLDETKQTVSEYIQRYDSAWSDLMQSQQYILPQGEQSVLTTWKLSYDQVLSANPHSAGLLDLWAFFSPDDVWLELLSHSAPKLQHAGAPAWLCELASSKSTDEKAMIDLSRYSLVTRRGDRVCINSVFHKWCLHNCEKLRRAELYSYAALCAEDAIRRAEDAKSTETIRRLLPHVRSLATRISDRSEGEDEALMNAHWKMADLLQTWENLAEADLFYGLALRGYTSSKGPHDPSTLELVGCLGILRAKQGKPVEAEQLILRAHGGLEKHSGSEDDVAALNMLNQLGIVYIDQARFTEAEDVFRRALGGLERALGSDDGLVLSATYNLGNSLVLQGKRLGEAQSLFERVLRREQNTLGSHHPSTMRTAMMLLALRVECGKMSQRQAESECRDLLRDATEKLGPQHPLTLNALDLLALWGGGDDPHLRGDRSPEQESFSRVLHARAETFGPEDPLTLQAALDLGMLLLEDEDRGSKLANAKFADAKLRESNTLGTLPLSHRLRRNFEKFKAKFEEASTNAQGSIAAPTPATASGPEKGVVRSSRGDGLSRMFAGRLFLRSSSRKGGENSEEEEQV